MTDCIMTLKSRDKRSESDIPKNASSVLGNFHRTFRIDCVHPCQHFVGGH